MINLCWIFCDLAKGCFAGSCKEANIVFCFVSCIKKPTYCQLLTSFRRSNRMFVDVFIECVAWSYWWTWCVLLIICNSKHFSFFVFYFNVSDKISSTPLLLLSFPTPRLLDLNSPQTFSWKAMKVFTVTTFKRFIWLLSFILHYGVLI